MNNAGNTASIEERDAHCGDQHRGTVGARFIAPNATSVAMSRSRMFERKQAKLKLPFPAAQTRRDRLCGRIAHLDKVYDVHTIPSLDITNFTARLISCLANITILERRRQWRSGVMCQVRMFPGAPRPLSGLLQSDLVAISPLLQQPHNIISLPLVTRQWFCYNQIGVWNVLYSDSAWYNRM